MPAGLFDKLAHAFEDEAPSATTLKDVSLLNSRLGFGAAAPLVPPLPGGLFGSTSAASTQQLGVVYVHSRRPEEAVPIFPGLPLSGIPTIDAAFRRRGEQALQDMARAFSDFSLSGLEWAEQRACANADLAAERAAEDAAIARRRFEEDATLAAKRAQEDEERAGSGSSVGTSFEGEREQAEAALHEQWKGKFSELRASLEEAVAAHEAQKALDEQRKREEEARVSQAAAREAARAAEHASRLTEAAEDAHRLAELAKLRIAQVPSVRSIALVSAGHIAPALRFTRSTEPAEPLTLYDRSWWKLLHLLEAEGLTPPLKGTNIAASLFGAIDADSDGAVPTADAAYMLSLLTSGSPRDRIDAGGLACTQGRTHSGAPVPRAPVLRALSHAHHMGAPAHTWAHQHAHQHTRIRVCVHITPPLMDLLPSTNDDPLTNPP